MIPNSIIVLIILLLLIAIVNLGGLIAILAILSHPKLEEEENIWSEIDPEEARKALELERLSAQVQRMKAEARTAELRAEAYSKAAQEAKAKEMFK